MKKRALAAAAAGLLLTAAPAGASTWHKSYAKAATKTPNTHLTNGDAQHVVDLVMVDFNDLFATNTSRVRCWRRGYSKATCRVIAEGPQRIVLRVRISEDAETWDAFAKIAAFR